ncbi:MAG: hypothetical protein ABR548_09495 [Actinomycetota bacterium]
MRVGRLRIIVAIGAALVALSAVSPGQAGPLDPPANDSFSSATVVTELPFAGNDDATFATAEAGEPACGTKTKSLWYSFSQPEDVAVRISVTGGTAMIPSVAAFTGDAPGTLTPVAGCASSRSLILDGGRTYRLQVTQDPTNAGAVHLGIQKVSSVQGTVTGLNDEPLDGICIEANGFEDGYSYYWDYAQTGADGRYTFLDLYPADYKFVFYDCEGDDFLYEWYDNKPTEELADTVTVADGQAIAGIDASMGPAGVITGSITDEAAAPIRYTCITAYQSGVVKGWGTTGDDGTYVMLVPETGSYKIRFGCEYDQYVTEWYDNKPTEGAADDVNAVVGQTKSDIDAVLARRAAPVNDDFADALDVPSLPFEANVDAYFSTAEMGEPAPCGTSVGRSVWYKYTSAAHNETTDDLVMLNTRGSEAAPVLGVYSGSDLASLQTVACNHANTRGAGQIAFRATPGTTYYVQVATQYEAGRLNVSFGGGVAPTHLALDAPVPCIVACPYWSNPQNSAAENEAACGTPSPDGSWAEQTITVPQEIDGKVPTELAFLLSPAIDHDSFICLPAGGPPGQKRFVATGANTTSDKCTLGPLNCAEQVTIPVQPGESLILRVYNWADTDSNPNAEYAFKV